jgi:hypothetical protein
MANITITKRMRGVFWFFALWAAGVGATMLLALPFKLLIQWGTAAGF